MISLLNQERGITLIEVIVSQVTLIIGAMCIWSLFIAGSRLNAESEDKTVAANIAQLRVEEIMNTRFRYIVEENPPGETAFSSETQAPPYWVHGSDGEWIPSLPEGKCTVSYPDGVDADPLRIRVDISWDSNLYTDSSLSIETLVSMTPGRFRPL